VNRELERINVVAVVLHMLLLDCSAGGRGRGRGRSSGSAGVGYLAIDLGGR
jgi:hypothetical protein